MYKEYPMLTGEGRWYHGKCRDWILKECPLCGKLGADYIHTFEKHLKEKGCGESCFITQNQGRGGFVDRRHQGHRTDKQQFAMQE